MRKWSESTLSFNIFLLITTKTQFLFLKIPLVGAFVTYFSYSYNFSLSYYVWFADDPLIHSANPQSRPVVIIVFMLSIHPTATVRTFQNLAKQYKWRDCGSGWVDHWWHLFCNFLFSAWTRVKEELKTQHQQQLSLDFPPLLILLLPLLL